MNQKELSELTDEELRAVAKKSKNNNIANAFFIGFLIGIIAYSIVVNSVGIFTLIPLYFAYRLFTQKNNKKEIEELLKERNLK